MPTIIKADQYEDYDPNPVSRFKDLKFETNENYKDIHEYLDEVYNSEWMKSFDEEQKKYVEKVEDYNPNPVNRLAHLKYETNKNYNSIEEFLEERNKELEMEIAKIGLDELRKNTPGFVKGKEKT